jgi:hypothetical protein
VLIAFWWSPARSLLASLSAEISAVRRDRSDPIDYGEVPTLDSIIVYQASDGNVCDTLKLGDTTAKAVSVEATYP